MIMIFFFEGGGEEYMKLGGGGAYAIWSRQEGGGQGENKARNETPVLGLFKFNCLVPKGYIEYCYYYHSSGNQLTINFNIVTFL